MSLSATIIDQQVRSLAERHQALLVNTLKLSRPEHQRSAAFVALAVKTYLELSEEEALERLTEGGGDFGIDALDCSPANDGEFVVTLFQGKYKQKFTSDAKFPRTAVEKMLLAVQSIFDPDKPLTLNKRLAPRVEEARSLVRDGMIPQIRVVLCNNGDRWDQEADQLIANARLGSQVTWAHISHDSIVEVLKSPKYPSVTLQLNGRATVETFDFRRVLIGRISVQEIARVFHEFQDRLLERNIRRYLGLSGNPVNEAIQRTLQNLSEQSNFYFYNNGITIACEKFSHNELQAGNWPVRLANMQVINGGQTCKTIERVLYGSPDLDASQASVLVRIYEVPSAGDDHLIRNITYATNSQSPVDLRDLMSNDEIQKKLALSIQQLGYTYRSQRSESVPRQTDVSSATAAEAILAVWRMQPHQAKFRTTEHFGRLYPTIFTDELNGAQVILAVLLFRIAENHRKRLDEDAPLFLHYASCFIAMEMGKSLLLELGLSSHRDLDHTKFVQAVKLIESRGDGFHTEAVQRIDAALKRLYGRDLAEIKLQRLSATFRRGDLIEELSRLYPTSDQLNRPEVSQPAVKQVAGGNATGKKAPAKKVMARKATPKKAPARKGTARKGTARKGTARKGTARKGTPRKGTAR